MPVKGLVSKKGVYIFNRSILPNKMKNRIFIEVLFLDGVYLFLLFIGFFLSLLLPVTWLAFKPVCARNLAS